MNARILALALLVPALVLGQAVPARAQLVSEGQEIAIGRRAAAELEGEFGLAADPSQRVLVERIGRRLAAISGRPGLPWRFRVLDTAQVNAISLPGGFVYATRGMLSFVQSTDELAFVLAHEVGHVDERHHVALIQRDFFFTIVIALVLGRDPGTAQIGSLVGALLNRGFSREAEFAADAAGVRLAHRAGFNAGAGLTFMERLRAAEGRDPSTVEVLFRTHPALGDRIVRVRALLKELGYRVARGGAEWRDVTAGAGRRRAGRADDGAVGDRRVGGAGGAAGGGRVESATVRSVTGGWAAPGARPAAGG